MKKQLIFLFLFISFYTYSQQGTETYYYYCYFYEKTQSNNGGFYDTSIYGEDYRPTLIYTIVKSVKCDTDLDHSDAGIGNTFGDYLDAKYGSDLPYGWREARVFKSRKEAEEHRLKSIGMFKKHVKYRLKELEYFNYYCD